MGSMREGLELIFVAVFAGFTADIAIVGLAVVLSGLEYRPGPNACELLAERPKAQAQYRTTEE